jgi:threonine dehydratase
LQATIFVPTISAPAKRAAISGFGATLEVAGEHYADAFAACVRFQASTGAVGVHAYDAVATLLGQGTVGLEFEAQAPHLDTVLVAVGGGGLIGGIAAWYGGRISVVGVEPASSRCLHAGLEAGYAVDVEVSGIAADSLGAKQAGALMFPIAKAFVDRVVLVDDAAIAGAQTRLWRHLRIAAEPGGATALAALTSGAYKPLKGERVGVLICGGNVDLATIVG